MHPHSVEVSESAPRYLTLHDHPSVHSTHHLLTLSRYRCFPYFNALRRLKQSTNLQLIRSASLTPGGEARPGAGRVTITGGLPGGVLTNISIDANAYCRGYSQPSTKLAFKKQPIAQGFVVLTDSFETDCVKC